MLIALLLGYLLLGGTDSGPWFLGGETYHQMAKEVAKTEPDKDKRKELDRTVKQIEEEAKRLKSERSKLEKEMLAALENHDTPAERFQQLGQRADSINTDATKSLLELRFRLRGQLSEEQWRQLFPPPPPAPSSRQAGGSHPGLHVYARFSY